MFYDIYNWIKQEKPKEEKQKNGEKGRIGEPELTFDFGDCNFETDFDVPEVDLNVAEF